MFKIISLGINKFKLLIKNIDDLSLVFIYIFGAFKNFCRFDELKIKLFYSDWYIIVLPFSIGEITMTALMTKELKKRQQGRVLLLTNNKSKAKYLEHFDCVDKALVCSNSFLKPLIEKDYTFFQLTKGEIFSINRGLLGEQFYKPADNFFEVYKNHLLYDDKMEISKLMFDNKLLKKLHKKYNLDKPTILITPDARALNSLILSDNFWLDIAQNLQKRGFQVFVNSLERYKNAGFLIKESLYETVLLASMVKGVIGFRSGLLDAFASNINTKMFVIYPTPDFQMYRYKTNEEMREVFIKPDWSLGNDEITYQAIVHGQSLVNMFKNYNIEEYHLRKNKEEELKDRIFEWCKQFS